MPPLPQPRAGHVLRIKDRPVEFSFWPMERTTRRYGLGTRVFATDPWTVIRRSAERRCLASTKDSAFSLLEQAEDFFQAAESGVKAAKPLLMYYCMMNLAKAFILSCQNREDVNNAMHGLSEKLDPPPKDEELIDAWLNSETTPAAGPKPPGNQKIKVFDEFLFAISGSHIPSNNFRYDLVTLLPQVVPGHRLWVEGTAGGEKERFVSLQRIEFWQDQAKKEIWLRLYLFSDDLKRINVGHHDFLTQAQLDGLYHEIAISENVDDRPLICLEQTAPVKYTHHPSDKVPELVSTVRHKLWRTVLNTPPYRKYYCYVAPTAEHPQVLPQVLSMYAITFYLGSIVRYRPHHFDSILDKKFGPFIEAFLNDQPRQYIYLMASEFAEKEVTKAAIV